VLVAGDARRQRQSRDRRDARQRLAAKAHRDQPFEIVERRDLARRMPRQSERQFVARDAAAVVADADQSRAAAFDVDRDRARPGIERVLDELLDDRGRPLHDLSGRYLIDELRRQDANRHSTSPTARTARLV
jgi:hypothetical protein